MLGVAEKTIAGLVRGVGKAGSLSAARTTLLPLAAQQKRLYAAPAKTLPKGQVITGTLPNNEGFIFNTDLNL
jgi:hypothetical protein